MSPKQIVADTFRALRIRNYRLFTLAQLLSVSGTWMQTVAQAWLVLKLSGGGLELGIATGLQFLPTALFGLWGGVLADRFDKRRILMLTQALAGALAGTLAVLTFTGIVELWMVFALAFALGLVTAADTPARQAFVIEMVGPDDVANAVGLNSAVFNTARIAGPALAAVVIATTGLAGAFLLNALTYLAPVLALRAMDARALHVMDREVRRRGLLREGLRYAARTPTIRGTLLLLAVLATLGFNFTTTIPLLAKFTFDAGVNGYALLTGMLAGGGLIGALWTARRARPTPRLLATSGAVFGAAALGVAFAPTMVAAGALLALTGAASMTFIATANSTLQLRAPAPLRGRMMALYALVFLGSTPFGGPLIGAISEQFGARAGVGVGGAGSLVAAGIAFVVLARRTTRGRLAHDAIPHVGVDAWPAAGRIMQRRPDGDDDALGENDPLPHAERVALDGRSGT